MVNTSSLQLTLKIINTSYLISIVLYFYGDFAYLIIYGTIGPYINDLDLLRTLIDNEFNMVISNLYIEVEQWFSIY